MIYLTSSLLLDLKLLFFCCYKNAFGSFINLHKLIGTQWKNTGVFFLTCIKVYSLTEENVFITETTQRKYIPSACQPKRKTTLCVLCIARWLFFLICINWILILGKPYTSVHTQYNYVFLQFNFCSWSLKLFNIYYIVMWLLLTVHQ